MRRQVLASLVFGALFWGAHFLKTLAEKQFELPWEGLLVRLVVPPAVAFFVVRSLPTAVSWAKRLVAGWAVILLGTFLVGFGTFLVLCMQRGGGSIGDNVFCGLVAMGSMLVALEMVLSLLLSVAVVPLAVAFRTP